MFDEEFVAHGVEKATSDCQAEPDAFHQLAVAEPLERLAPISRAGGTRSSDENGVVDYKMLWLRPILTSEHLVSPVMGNPRTRSVVLK